MDRSFEYVEIKHIIGIGILLILSFRRSDMLYYCHNVSIFEVANGYILPLHPGYHIQYENMKKCCEL